MAGRNKRDETQNERRDAERGKRGVERPGGSREETGVARSKNAQYPFGPFELLCRIQLAYAWSRMSNAQRAYHKFNMPSGKAI